MGISSNFISLFMSTDRKIILTYFQNLLATVFIFHLSQPPFGRPYILPSPSDAYQVSDPTALTSHSGRSSCLSLESKQSLLFQGRSTLPQLLVPYSRGHCKNICSYIAFASPLVSLHSFQIPFFVIIPNMLHLPSKYLLIDWLVLHNLKGLLTLLKK